MDAFHDFADMARDYGLIRYFLITVAVATALMTALFLWGHVDTPEPASPEGAPPASSTSY